MEIRRVGFVGVRSPAAAEAAVFFRDVFGLSMLHDDPDWSILQLPSGTFDYLEFYGQQFADDRVIPPGVSMFVAFVVDDVTEARKEIVAAGAPATEVVWADQEFGEAYDGVAWFFVQAPDGNTYCVEQVPQPS